MLREIILEAKDFIVDDINNGKVINKNYNQWNSVKSEVLSSDLTNMSVTADINTNNEWRVYIGSKSRGFSYYFDLSDNERINMKFDANQPGVYMSEKTDDSPVSIYFVIIPLALIPILRRKYLHN